MMLSTRFQMRNKKLSCSRTRLVTVKDGQHFLSFSHSKEVADNLVEFVEKYNKQESTLEVQMPGNILEATF